MKPISLKMKVLIKILKKDDSGAASVAGVEMVLAIGLMATGAIMMVVGFRIYFSLTSGVLGFFGNFNPSWIFPVIMGAVLIFVGMSVLAAVPKKPAVENPGENQI